MHKKGNRKLVTDPPYCTISLCRKSYLNVVATVFTNKKKEAADDWGGMGRMHVSEKTCAW